MPGKLRRYFIEMNMVGGRGGTRTRGPLLAEQRGENTKLLCWCRFPLFKCPEVVPSSGHGGPAKGFSDYRVLPGM